MSTSPDSSPQEDRTFHTYDTRRIPWYVRAMWIGFWIGAIWYAHKYVVPAVREFL